MIESLEFVEEYINDIIKDKQKLNTNSAILHLEELKQIKEDLYNYNVLLVLLNEFFHRFSVTSIGNSPVLVCRENSKCMPLSYNNHYLLKEIKKGCEK